MQTKDTVSFTFHDVSINTEFSVEYILIEEYFTFHDVSINTGDTEYLFVRLNHFTFHDVSINTTN